LYNIKKEERLFFSSSFIWKAWRSAIGIFYLVVLVTKKNFIFGSWHHNLKRNNKIKD